LERLTPPPTLAPATLAQRAPGRWQIGTVTAIRDETPTVRSLRVSVPMWIPHLPGQHYEVRLTAPDGYRAQRSYSVASSPLDAGEVELTVQRLQDGEVSTYIHDVLREGDELEVRGPFASYFVWRQESPVLLVGGGSGVVPLMAMLRHRRLTAPGLPMRLLYSVRSPEEVIYADELGPETVLTFTRAAPPGWSGHHGRIDQALVAREAAMYAEAGAFVCGTDGFVETATGFLLAAGVPPEEVRTERFGPTG
jgi:ferredoxin-NADP reductase